MNADTLKVESTSSPNTFRYLYAEKTSNRDEIVLGSELGVYFANVDVKGRKIELLEERYF